MKHLPQQAATPPTIIPARSACTFHATPSGGHSASSDGDRLLPLRRIVEEADHPARNRTPEVFNGWP
jgi:hypothetical protein